MNLILFGPPGAGKGTQSALLIERKGLKHISTGDLFRSAIKNQTPLGKEAKSILDAGNLVPDSITIGLVKEVMGQLGPGSKGVILDGFPRNVVQAEALDKIMSDLGMQIDKSIFLQVPMDQLKDRLSGRRVCKACGATYHVTSKPPKVLGVCDVCGGEVIQRPDDKEDVIQNRLDAYEKSTSPLREFYKNRGRYAEVNGLGSTEEVFSRVQEALVGVS